MLCQTYCIYIQSETLLQKLQVDLDSAQAAKEKLETDNLALYSKIRYLQSYGASSAGGAPFKSPQVTCHNDVVGSLIF